MPILVMAILLPTCVADGPKPNSSAPRTEPPSLLWREAAENNGPLVFPPERTDRRPRPAPGDGPSAPVVVRPEAPAPRVIWPDLSEDEVLQLSTERLRITFDQKMERPGAEADSKGVVEASPKTLIFTPDVPGHAFWTDATHLEYVPEKPLAIGKKYTVGLGEVKSAAGARMESPWEITLVPRVKIAGKILSHEPKAGEPRIIAIHPSAGATVGPRPELSVLYDQPMDPGRAAGLLRVVAEGGARVPVSLSHPPGPTFQGITVDRRFVIQVAPTAPLARETRYWLTADKAYPGAVPQARSFDVAAPLAITGVECPSGESDCSVDGTAIDTKGTEIVLTLNHWVGMRGKEIVKLVRVTPKVQSLHVYPSGESLLIGGSFERSTTYDVSLVGLVDPYGSRLAAPFHATLTRAAEDASITMPSGVLLLDREGMKRFAITSRNVAEATLSFWPVEDAALASAVRSVRAGTKPDEEAAIEVTVPVKSGENDLVRTEVDLTRSLAPDRPYVAAVGVKSTSYGADLPYKGRTEPLALVSPVGASQLAVHVEKRSAQTLVHVARLDTGEPVRGARIGLLDEPNATPTRTDENGLALFGVLPEAWLDITAEVKGGQPGSTAGAARALVDLRRLDVTAAELFPRIATASEEEEEPHTARSVVLTDRGIYRPGSKVHLFANLRRPAGLTLTAMGGADVVVRAFGPGGDEVFHEAITTDDTGSAAVSFDLARSAKLGRHRLVVQPAGDEKTDLAETIVQVADFEAPRFTVDVDASASDARKLDATVRARYLFGAPMTGGRVAWTARREPAAIASGPFEGFLFRQSRDWWDERARASSWSRAGEATVGADGTARIEQPITMEKSAGPQRISIEAEVTDASFRAIAGRASTIVHTADRYVGLRVARRWGKTSEPFHVELGVVSREGKAIEGALVTAILKRVSYARVARRDAGGAVSYEWIRTTSPAGRCSVKSATSAVACDVRASNPGDFEITAEVDGRAGGSTTVWAWNGPGSSGPEIPSRGRSIEIIPDRPSYAAGDTAKLFLTSPFAAATAIITTDAAGAVPRAQRIDGSAAVIEVPLSAADAPHVHAMVTLLPIAEKNAGAEYRIGAVRLPISLEGERLALSVTPSKPMYRPGDEVEIALSVADGASPSKGARVAIAVADEGVLRLTGYHAPDPVTEMRPGRALFAQIHDTRAELAALVARSHVAGDGDEGGGKGRGGDTERSLTNARKTFAETAFWKPDLRTDDDGQSDGPLQAPRQPDDVPRDGDRPRRRGERRRHRDLVPRLEAGAPRPALPRFVSLGDAFEAAALLHSTEETRSVITSAQTVVVALGGRDQRVKLSPGGHARVAFPVRVACEGEASPGELLACPTAEAGGRPSLHLAFEARSEDGARLDAVETRLPATMPGLDETPRLTGSFTKTRTIALHVPAHVTAPDGHDTLQITLGAQMWPELGDRMRYLLGYPHGCVEQTTSSTLPLIAARDIAPRIGLDMVSDADLRAKIRAGVERLATMRTPGGGLGYWPGDAQPNTYGTAYAIRALVLAKAAGVEVPDDLLDGMARYLQDRMLADDTPPEVTAAIAQSLSELGRLDPGASDRLFDSASKQSVFGSASLALALASLPGQDERVRSLLDRIEAGIDERGELVQKVKSDDFYYYGSPTRSKAQAVIALRRLRPASPRLAVLLRDLARSTDQYSTQATSYSLLALAEEMRRFSPTASDARVLLDGREVGSPVELAGGRRFEIPLAEIAGKDATLTLVSSADLAIGFSVRATWRRPSTEASSPAFCGDRSPAIYRAYTDAKGGPVDLAAVHPGDVLRVALLARKPDDIESARFGYLAITDRLPAGFEPVQQDLATVAAQPDVGGAHPFAAWLRSSDERASFLELHDDRVNVYFDTARGDDVIATYLVRATTPGTFAIPPATAELMYEPESLGATEPQRVVVR